METNARASLKFQLNQAILEQARIRSIILAIVVFVVVAGFSLNAVLYSDYFSADGDNMNFIYIGVGLLIFLSARGVVFARLLPTIYKKRGHLPWLIRYGNTFFEISIPSFTLFLFATQDNPYIALVAPIVSLYFVFILLSTLELDWKLSVFSGVVSGIQYVAIAIFYIDKVDPHESFMFLDLPIFYIGRGMIMVLAGVTAGFVGNQIKKTFIRYYRKKEESDKIQKLFGQQVSQAIVAEFLKDNFEIRSRRRNACIMFLDIRGFTPFTENMTPEEIIAYQNKVFPFMFEVVMKHHGIVNQLMGDGFMATFGAPVAFENDCLNAVNSAREILEGLRAKNPDGEFGETRIGIGIHYGEVVTGNVGSALRQQYSITGNTVIVASRIEQLNKRYHTSLLISKTVHDRIKNEHADGKSLGEIRIDGLKKPMELFQLA